ncbi:hypothetical protein P2318_29980 [Myxococcaceae bacterium GXIMD 01537]
MARVEPSSVIVTHPGIRKLVEQGLEAAGSSRALPVDLSEADQLRMRSGLAQALIELEEAEASPGVLVAPSHGPTALLQSYLALRAVETGRLARAAHGMLEARFDANDLTDWTGSFFSWWRGLRKHDWLAASSTPERIGDGARLALLSDFGTGLYGAPVCARSIENAARPLDVLLHLGGIYYSGTESEVERRFLDVLPRAPNLMRRALNSEHEMHSGGYGYFHRALPALGQLASHFALENERWLLVGLDTGYLEGDLSESQVAWFGALMERARERNQRVIVTSHHAPFSRLGRASLRLTERLMPWLDAGRVFAWYWGHEHRCVVYARHTAWKVYGRCLGHAGFAYSRTAVGGAPVHRVNPDGSRWLSLEHHDDVPASRVLDGPNPYVVGHEERYGPNGYLTLELGETSLLERVHAADGTVLHEQELS